MVFKKSKQWFRPVRRSYLPATWQGMVIYSLFLAYNVALAVGWYRRGHTVWMLFTVTIPLMVAATVLTQFIASKNSK